jgi:hypothetical protein
MRIGTQFYLLRRRIKGVLRRALTRLRRPTLELNQDEPAPGGGSKIIWTTQVVAGRQDELEIVRRNLERLQPVLAWACLTVDGTSADLASFSGEHHWDGFHNVVWLGCPKVVCRTDYPEIHGYYNRHSFNYLRGWMCSIDGGEECPAELFCHTDGDWAITIRPESIEPLHRFFHRYPQVVAISRSLDRFMVDEPGMWPDKDSGGALWFGNRVLSSNVIISPFDRFRPLLLRAWEVFPRHRGVFLEVTLGRLLAERGQVVAYPKEEYFRDRFFIDLLEKREPFPMPSPSDRSAG